MDVKNNFVSQLSTVRSNASADFLKDIYYAAGDTIDLQYTALSALLHQQTAYAYNVFKDIMVSEPPVLDVGNSSSSTYTTSRGKNSYSGYSTYRYNDDDDYESQSFLDNLYDSLQLTTRIFKDLLPLINVHDYETTIMGLTGMLVDSSMISAKDYEMYETKFLIEAKQLLKKQMILEKNKSIEKAQKNEEDDYTDVYSYSVKNEDNGNNELDLYATLLMPFWDKNPAAQQFIKQLLKSNDNRLKYSTAMLLLRNHKSLPDTILNYFAAMDEYRYELYSDLRSNESLNLFPSTFNNQVKLAKSKLLDISSNYNKPDSLVYLDKLPVQFKDRNGFVLFFKYRNKKDENTWRLATVGIVPNDSKQFEFDSKKLGYWEERQYNFTDLSNTKLDKETPIAAQLKKALKKMLYSKRNSAMQFYKDEDRMREDYDFDE